MCSCVPQLRSAQRGLQLPGGLAENALFSVDPFLHPPHLA